VEARGGVGGTRRRWGRRCRTIWRISTRGFEGWVHRRQLREGGEGGDQRCVGSEVVVVSPRPRVVLEAAERRVFARLLLPCSLSFLGLDQVTFPGLCILSVRWLCPHCTDIRFEY
jgi:hypothetical protein